MSHCRISICITRLSYLLLLLVFGPFTAPTLWADTLHHDLRVKLESTQARISVSDHIQLPADTTNSIEFSLHSGLDVATQDAELKSMGKTAHGHLRHYRLTNLPKSRRVTLSYQGKITADKTEDQFGMPEFVLAQDGVYLDSASAWFPPSGRPGERGEPVGPVGSPDPAGPRRSVGESPCVERPS